MEKEILTFFMNNLIAIKVSEKSESVFRCPFCGDSQNHPHHGHLYVNIHKGVFNCFRCGEKGTIDKIINYLASNSDVKRFELKVKKYYRNKNEIENKIDLNIIEYQTIVNGFRKDLNFKLFKEFFKYKEHNTSLNYLNYRLGIFNDVQIFLKFLKMNEKNMLFILNNNDLFFKKYFPFITNFKCENYISYLSFFKYNVYSRNIFNKFFKIYKFDKTIKDYVMFFNNDVELSDIEELNVVCAEGIFDLLNVFLYWDNLNVNNLVKPHLFIASSGKNSLHKAISFITNLFCFKTNIYFLVDSDVRKNKKFLSTLLKRVYYNIFVNQIYLIKNGEQHDFGEYLKLEKMEVFSL